MKGVLLIIDGLGDLPNPALDGRTPLEAARTPVMDRLAANGRYGLLDPTGGTETPSTYSGAGMLLGFIPGSSGVLARGPIEAAGVGLALDPGDVALRANFATLKPDGGGFLVLDRRAGRIKTGVRELADALDNVDLGGGVTATLRSTHQHRGVLVLSGAGLDPNVSDTDPGDRPPPAQLARCMARTEAAEATAKALNDFVRLAYERLHAHPVNQRRAAAGQPPANGVITRGAGAATRLVNSVNAAGLSACVITGCNTVKGLGLAFGFDVRSDAQFTGDMDTDLDAKISAAIEELGLHDLVFIHVKAPDIFAHDRDALGKRDFLERLDSALTPLAEQPVMIAVAADHTTDSITGLHTGDPVPALLSHPRARNGAATVKFGEKTCRGGNMPRQVSGRFLQKLVKSLQPSNHNSSHQ